MAFYESVFIARQDISAPQVDVIADALTQVIEQGGGSVNKREYWGLRSLSYRIKKNRKGHYVLLNIDAEAERIHELERQMRIHEDVLRYITIRVESLEEGPSAMLQSRSGRDDRGRREGRGRGGDGPGGRGGDGPGGRGGDGPGGRGGEGPGGRGGDGPGGRGGDRPGADQSSNGAPKEQGDAS